MGEATGPVSDTRSDEQDGLAQSLCELEAINAAVRRFRSAYATDEPTDWHSELRRLDFIGLGAMRDAATTAMWLCIGYEAERDSLRRRLDEANRRIEAAHVALRYIASPTMGLPSGVDPEQFAREGATDSSVRLALQACIRTARAALSDPTEGDTQ